MKGVSPLQRYASASAHEYQHLSKFKYCPYFVTVVTGSLKDWVLGPVSIECYAKKYMPDLTSLEARRKTLKGDFNNPATTQFYTVALADIALGMHYMHTAKLIHGDLNVNELPTCDFLIFVYFKFINLFVCFIVYLAIKHPY